MGAKANITQESFLGGEWQPQSLGRIDQPAYRTATSVMLNQLPVEQGAVTRRSGTEILGPTYKRSAAKLLPFQSNASVPYAMEITAGTLNSGADGALKLWYSTGPVCTNDRQVLTASSSSGGVLSLTTTSAHGWSVGDQFIIFCPSATVTAANAAVVANRTLSATAASGSSLTLKDDLGNALPTNITASGLNGATVIRLLRFTLTGLGTGSSLSTIRAVQAQTESIILTGLAPKQLTVTTDRTSGSDADPVMTLATVSFLDGPYLDPTSTFGTACGTVSGYSGSITYTPSDGTTFATSDVGRLIRLWTQPAAWNSGTTYNYGNTVTYPAGTSAYWVSIDKNNANTDQVPGTASLQTTNVQLTYWAPSPTEGQWAWGTITAQATTSCTVSLTTALNSNNGTTVSGCQLGVYKSGQYPTCGIYTEGRLFLAGALVNRIDGCMSNGISSSGITFSPTDIYNNVNDNNGISETFNFDDVSSIYWMAPDTHGILIGTNGGEILLASSTLDDPMTPTNIRARRATKYMAANVEPRRIGTALIFVQRYQIRLEEYIEVLNLGGSAGFTAKHLNEFAKHISAPGIKEIAYQEETVPVVWCVMNDGSFAGCTYRRISRYATEAPVFQAWHRHQIGDGTISVNSICVTPGANGLSDSLYLNTYDSNSQYWVEFLRPLFENV